MNNHRLRLQLFIWPVAFLIAMLTACSSEPRFEIKCNIPGLTDEAVEMLYYNGRFNAVTVHARDGKLTLKGSSAVPALVDVWRADSTLLFSVIAVDGDRITVDFDPEKPYEGEVKGSADTEMLWKFCRENQQAVVSGPSAQLDSLIEQFIIANPSSRAATVSLMTLYDLNSNPVKADSLLNRLDADARNLSSIRDFSQSLAVAALSTAHSTLRPISFKVTADSTLMFAPYRASGSLLMITDRALDTATVSLLKALRKDFSKDDLNILEASVVPDSARYSAIAKKVDASWQQVWVPGGYGNNSLIGLSIPSAPYFIAVHKSGEQRYRGESAAEADSVLRSFIE